MASTGHSGSQSVQSMHSSGSIVSMFGPSWKQSTGHTSTQSVYLHLMQASVTTKVIAAAPAGGVSRKVANCAIKTAGRSTRGRPAPGARGGFGSDLLVGYVQHDAVELVRQHDL